MNIELDNFVIKSEERCFGLFEKKKGKKRDTEEDYEYESTIGYYTDFSYLLKSLLDRKLLKSEAKTLQEVYQLIKEFNIQLKEWMITYEK